MTIVDLQRIVAELGQARHSLELNAGNGRYYRQQEIANKARAEECELVAAAAGAEVERLEGLLKSALKDEPVQGGDA